MPQSTPRRIRIYVEHFSVPPMEKVVGSVRSVFRDNLAGYEVDLDAESVKPDHQVLGVDQFFWGVMQRTEDMFRVVEPPRFTLCIAPIFVEFRGFRTPVNYNIITVAARSSTGYEWLYSQFVEPKAPRQLVETVAGVISGVLEKRNALDAPESESALALQLTTLAAAGVDHALGKTCIRAN